ncbi:MAG: hypothetical protein K8U57_12635 [Planctomycetes bacterium]|nr:hypothetical protein [Planctomycetota bacterium]
MEPADSTPTTPTPRTPAELAALAAQLDNRREALAKNRRDLEDAETRKQAAILEANREYSAAVTLAYSDFATTADPLNSAEPELSAAVSESEGAATELEKRKARVAELIEQLNAAESVLPKA